MPDRVYAGDDEQYFPDFGVWLKPGDPVPDDAPDDDPRFIPASKSHKRAAAAEQHGTEE